MSGSTTPEVGTLGMIESNRAFRSMQLAVWTGHGWLPLRGMQSFNIQTRMHRMDDFMGHRHAFAGVREVEVHAMLDYHPMPVPEGAPIYDARNVSPGQPIRFGQPAVNLSGTLTGRIPSADPPQANTPRAGVTREFSLADLVAPVPNADVRIEHMDLREVEERVLANILGDAERRRQAVAEVQGDELVRAAEQEEAVRPPPDPPQPRGRRIRFLEGEE